MYCTNCGKRLSDHAKFCSKCGNPVGNHYFNLAAVGLAVLFAAVIIFGLWQIDIPFLKQDVSHYCVWLSGDEYLFSEDMGNTDEKAVKVADFMYHSDNGRFNDYENRNLARLTMDGR
ncbi:MAG: zinc ribbon domain-containing protein [Lachnospiraceae bacterium]|nr:zinc ribbon domain-containing protein [Lachnospiraceae bacterium]